MVVRYYFVGTALLAASLGFLLPIPGKGPELQSQVETMSISSR